MQDGRPRFKKDATMPKSFNFNAPPFDSLTPAEQERVRAALDIGYFRRGEVILDAHGAPSHLYIMIKGIVQQKVGSEVEASYGKDDYFDVRSLFSGNSSSQFVAEEETLAYLLPKEMVKTLISENVQFGAMLFSDISEKLNALAERSGRRELQSLLTARVSQAFMHKPCYVTGDTRVTDVVRMLMARKISCVLVEDEGRTGIFTTTDLQKAALSAQPFAELKVSDFTSFGLVTVRTQDFVFDALVTMIHRRVHRVVVSDGEKICGILEQLDLMSFLANHSYIISLQIEQAETVEALEAISPQVLRLISILDSGGVKVELISRLAQELNHQTFAKVWQLVAPEALRTQSCLMVMGSEGRGEQVIRTDQDNGLIIANDYDADGVQAVCDEFNRVLERFGYPECAGNIMVRNALWRQSLSSFKETLRQWVQAPTPDSQMNLAIFMDAVPVAGDAQLLEAAKNHLHGLVTDNIGFFGHFARAIDSFEEPGHWWSRVLHLGSPDSNTIDIKKMGLFPIVHGVRALSLEAGLKEVSTVQRLDTLAQQNGIPRDMADDLVQSLHYLMGLKLKFGLKSVAMKQPPGNVIHLDELTSVERDILKDCLQQVKKFKALLRHHFRLDAF